MEGLDSTAAASIVDTLRSLADNYGKTIIAVIHQPTQTVFSTFDDLLLVSGGKQMYFGEISNVRRYMNYHGNCTAPVDIGTAEHIMDCISNEPLVGETEDDVIHRINRLADIAKVHNTVDLGRTPKANNGGEGGEEENGGNRTINGRKKNDVQRFHGNRGGGPRANILVQFRLLLKRATGEVFRGKAKLILNTVQQVMLAVIYGGIYTIGSNQASIQDRIGILWLIATGSMNMAVASSLRAFPKEKAIVSEEIASKMYATFPYFFGKAISELPMVAIFNSLFAVLVSRLTGLNNTTTKWRRFLGLNSMHGLAAQSLGLFLGAISPNSDVALGLLPPVIVLNMIFDGKHISEESVPRLLRWIPKLGLVRWCFEGFCINEFDGLKFDTTGPRRGPVAKTGGEALQSIGLGERKLDDVFKAQGIIITASWFLSYLGLALTSQKFQVMEVPSP